MKDYERATDEDISLTIEKLNSDEKTATIKIETTKFLRNFWLSSDKFGVRFDSNFKSLLPGSNYITISFDVLPEVEDFKMMWL